MKTESRKFQIIENFRFPVAGWIILIHELLERFSFYGMKGILAIYLNLYLGFDEDTSTILYHLFTGLSYLTPIFGAIIADNYLGRFKTILYVGIIYLIGHLLMPLTAIRKNIPGPLVGMVILAIGAGGIKSSVAAFGGDQLPTGNDQMVEKFFSLFYTSINIGAFIAQFVTPILRSDVSCVDKFCYPLAFGVPAATFLVTYIIFIAGTRTYKISPRSKNVLSEFVRCVYTASINYLRQRKHKRYKKVMDYARSDYSEPFIKDCQTALRIIVIFTPIPVFWALYDQQGSRWTLQAKNMDGRIGSTYIMKPEQIQAFNALFIIALIPIFDFIIYPVFNKMHMLVKPTSRLVTSYTVAAISFFVAGILQIYIVKGQSINFKGNNSRISLINTFDGCQLNGVIGGQDINLAFGGRAIYDVNEGINTMKISCNNLALSYNLTFFVQEMKTVVVSREKERGELKISVRNITVQRREGFGYIRYISTQKLNDSESILLKTVGAEYTISEAYVPVAVGKYELFCLNNSKRYDKCGRIDVIPSLTGSLTKTYNGRLLVLVEFEPRLVHMLWQLPQYILITGAEILCSITALSFAYSEAPESMKSLMQAVYLLTIFGGNIIVVFVATIGSQIGQTTEFFIFATLVLIAGFINWLLIRKFWDFSDTVVSPGDSQEMLEGTN